jgi:hypothetical protein
MPALIEQPPAVYAAVQEGCDVFDLGEALYGFLVRFGEEFDVGRVSWVFLHSSCQPASQLASQSASQ